jgi:hypothetical protein
MIYCAFKCNTLKLLPVVAHGPTNYQSFRQKVLIMFQTFNTSHVCLQALKWVLNSLVYLIREFCTVSDNNL